MVGSEREAVRVAYGTASVVIVEVDVDVLVRVPQISEATGPTGEGGPAVAGSRVRSTLVQSQIAPIGGTPKRGLPLWGVSEAERRSVLLQDVRDLVGVPRLMARFERHSDARREGLEGGRQPNGVGTEVGRQLQQNRPDLVAQAA